MMSVGEEKKNRQESYYILMKAYEETFGFFSLGITCTDELHTETRNIFLDK